MLTEASLGRFLLHFDRKDPILIVTASRSTNTPAENNKNNAIVRSLLSRAGFGFNRVVGRYVENVEDEGSMVQRVVNDDSCIVYGNREQETSLFNLGVAIGKKFNQESVFFVGENKTGYKPILYSTSDSCGFGPIGTIHKLGKLHVQVDADVMTIIRNKTYAFDWDDYQPAKMSETFNEAMWRSAFRKYLEENDTLDRFQVNYSVDLTS